jgi:transposase-like protein
MLCPRCNIETKVIELFMDREEYICPECKMKITLEETP